jgi:hypothetical protein
MPDNEICQSMILGVEAPLLCASVGLLDPGGAVVTDPARPTPSPFGLCFHRVLHWLVMRSPSHHLMPHALDVVCGAC